MSEPARPEGAPVETLVPEKLDLRSHTIAEDKREALLRLFPEARTEGGKLDFDRLKLALGETVDTGKERYGLTWPGKAECFKAIQTPSLGTLLPCREESVRFDETENLIIEGDNLEVLKLLQKSYLGKVKMIYIDPPYNTGNDFIYPDDYSESLQTYLQYTGQGDAAGRKFSTNAETSGRFHSKWLSMMYPRLYLARNLLRDDGVVFITIDDAEVDNLRKCCYEIFGEENFVAQIEWQKRYTRSNNTDDFTSVVDHIVVFSRSERFAPRLLERDDEANARYQNPDNDSRGPWKAIPFTNPLSPEERPNLAYPITHPNGRVILPTKKAWRSSQEVWKRLVQENRVWWGRNQESDVPSIKRFLNEVRTGMTPTNLWTYEFAGHTDGANAELKDLFGEPVFDFPKPTQLVRRMLQLSSSESGPEIVIDFFAGSGTTAHAVLAQNAEDGRQRRFVLVQLPEPTGRIDYPTITAIAKERVRRVIEKLDGQGSQLAINGEGDATRGFRVFKLAESNLEPWHADVSHDLEKLAEQLALHVQHLRQGRSDDDLLFEILLKTGFSLTTPIEKLNLAGKAVLAVAGGEMLVCLERELTLEAVRAIAERRPSRVVCLDAGFGGNDQLKANTVKTLEAKGVTSFRTV